MSRSTISWRTYLQRLFYIWPTRSCVIHHSLKYVIDVNGQERQLGSAQTEIYFWPAWVNNRLELECGFYTVFVTWNSDDIVIITQLADECCFVHVDYRLNKGIQYIMCCLIEMSKHQAELPRIHANYETMQRHESYPHDVPIVKNAQSPRTADSAFKNSFIDRDVE